MAEKITPPTKKVARADGFKNPSAHTTLTTPNPTFGEYMGRGRPADTAEVVEKSLFDGSPAH